jgi:hypothetical protein
MGFFQETAAKVGRIADALFFPKSQEESQELRYLREIYQNKNTNLQLNQWYRLLTETGNLVGFSYNCLCSTYYELLSINDWTHEHRCPGCKHDFDLFKTLGITKEVAPAKWPEHFATLPPRPRLSGQGRRPPYINTWQDNGEDEVVWAGTPPAGHDGWV